MLRYKSSSVTSSNTLETVQDSQIVAMGNKNVVFEQCGLWWFWMSAVLSELLRSVQCRNG